jgi:hypothetical protein
MTIHEKFENLKQEYESHFLGCKLTDNYINVPIAERIGSVGYSGDGTIELADLFAFAIISKNNLLIEKCITKYIELEIRAFDIYKPLLSHLGITKICHGFFHRDDIIDSKLDAKKFGLEQVNGSHQIALYDTCHSEFVSQDQIWHLAPVLAMVQNYREHVLNMLKYHCDNNHIEYNPYLSKILHESTFANLNIPFENRRGDSDTKFKMKVKVKRGYNGKYFSSLTDSLLQKLTGKTNFIWSKLWQEPFFWFAHFVWFPLQRKFFNTWDREYAIYAYKISIGSNIWRKRYLKKFKKYLHEEKIFMPDMLIYFMDEKFSETTYIDMQNTIVDYNIQTSIGTKTPINAMILYSYFINSDYYKLMNKKIYTESIYIDIE